MASRSFACHSLAHYNFTRRAAAPHATALRALKFEILKFRFLISRLGISRVLEFKIFNPRYGISQRKI